MRIEIASFLKVGLNLLVMIPLVGCVTMPHPFEKKEGTAGGKLTAPPPARLIIPVSTKLLLTDKNSNLFAKDMAQAMLDQTVPAVVRPAEQGDWLLLMRAQSQNGTVTPEFDVVAPNGKVVATRTGMPASVQDWSKSDPIFLTEIAQQSAPAITDVLQRLQASIMAADPHSLKNRQAQVYFAGVTGAPGDGNIVIGRQFVVSFNDKSNMIQSQKDKADYIVDCKVSVTNGASGTHGNPVQHVDIEWHIVDKNGKEAGKVTQINDVPAHSLDVYWNDTGSAVGQEAAGGVKHVISNYSGRNIQPLPNKNGGHNGALLTPPDLIKK